MLNHLKTTLLDSEIFRDGMDCYYSFFFFFFFFLSDDYTYIYEIQMFSENNRNPYSF